MRFSDFDLYKDLLREKAGLYISADKSYLLDSRLNPVAKKWGYPSVTTMTHALRGIADPGLIKDVIEAMVDYEAHFIYDTHTFAYLRDIVLPHMTVARKADKKLRIWVAACGTGQEPYSLAMFAKDHDAFFGNLKVDILATDISSSALHTAREGIYDQHAVQQGLPTRTLLEHFAQKGAAWHLKKDIKTMVRFQYANLLDSLTSLGTFDVILCRGMVGNLAFDLQARVFGALAGQLASDGYLFIGEKEQLPADFAGLRASPGRPGLYTR